MRRVHRAVIALAHGAYNRPAVMWSPWATRPDGPVDDVFLGTVWRLLIKSEVRELLIGGEVKTEVEDGMENKEPVVAR